MTEGAVNLPRVLEKLSYIHRQIARLRALSPEELTEELGDQFRSGAVKYALQTSIEAVIDTAYHLCAKVYHLAPDSAVDAMQILHANSVIDDDKFMVLVLMVKFRNKVVHGYADIDAAELRDIVEHHLGDFAMWDDAVRKAIGRLEPNSAS
ncbi:MAG: DUF86 domain-containing protein [Thermaerobacter sp.]|jgi:uncharacterized protein YutE (UPF0331/DUF86 family)|nr:DUF86 domain-containing protein [Thermaerobacter sp.]